MERKTQNGEAFGKPGIKPRWTRGNKDAIGTAYSASDMPSPMQRAMRTCELAGYGATAQVNPQLVEWNYGKFEGRTTAEIQMERPGWELFRDGCPGGETPDDVARRADLVVEHIRSIGGNALVFSSGHFLRVLAARWLNLKLGVGKYLLLSTASLSVLGYERNLSQPVIRLWNDTEQFGK